MFPRSSPLKEADRASLLDLGLRGRNSLDSPGTRRHTRVSDRTSGPFGGGGGQNSPKAARGSLVISAHKVTSLAATAYYVCLNSVTALARRDLV